MGILPSFPFSVWIRTESGTLDVVRDEEACSEGDVFLWLCSCGMAGGVLMFWLWGGCSSSFWLFSLELCCKLRSCLEGSGVVAGGNLAVVVENTVL